MLVDSVANTGEGVGLLGDDEAFKLIEVFDEECITEDGLD
jgi:hypothetical protein